MPHSPPPPMSCAMPAFQVHRTCDWTMRNYRFALTVNWTGLSQCDMGSLRLICRREAKSKGKPIVLTEAGGGENRGYDQEADGKVSRPPASPVTYTHCPAPHPASNVGAALRWESWLAAEQAAVAACGNCT